MFSACRICQGLDLLYLSTEDFEFSGKIFANFFLQKRKISRLHNFVYSVSCMMMYSLSFCFAILIRYSDRVTLLRSKAHCKRTAYLRQCVLYNYALFRQKKHI